jgi:hypothetical protein
MLCVVAVLAVLAAILLTALSGARARARLTKCSANIRTHYQAMQAYAGDAKDFFPFPFEADRGRSGRLLVQGLPHAVFNTTAIDFRMYLFSDGFWHLPVYEGLGSGAVADTLWCPVAKDILAEATNERAARATTFYRLSMAMFLSSASLNASRPTVHLPENWVGARWSDVRFPDRKCLITEDVPYHDPRFTDRSNVPPHPHVRNAGGCDGAMALRNTAETTPGVVPAVLNDGVTRDPQYWSMKTTPDGVQGRDW